MKNAKTHHAYSANTTTLHSQNPETQYLQRSTRPQQPVTHQMRHRHLQNPIRERRNRDELAAQNEERALVHHSDGRRAEDLHKKIGNCNYTAQGTANNSSTQRDFSNSAHSSTTRESGRSPAPKAAQQSMNFAKRAFNTDFDHHHYVLASQKRRRTSGDYQTQRSLKYVRHAATSPPSPSTIAINREDIIDLTGSDHDLDLPALLSAQLSCDDDDHRIDSQRHAHQSTQVMGQGQTIAEGSSPEKVSFQEQSSFQNVAARTRYFEDNGRQEFAEGGKRREKRLRLRQQLSPLRDLEANASFQRIEDSGGGTTCAIQGRRTTDFRSEQRSRDHFRLGDVYTGSSNIAQVPNWSEEQAEPDDCFGGTGPIPNIWSEQQEDGITCPRRAPRTNDRTDSKSQCISEQSQLQRETRAEKMARRRAILAAGGIQNRNSTKVEEIKSETCQTPDDQSRERHSGVLSPQRKPPISQKKEELAGSNVNAPEQLDFRLNTARDQVDCDPSELPMGVNLQKKPRSHRFTFSGRDEISALSDADSFVGDSDKGCSETDQMTEDPGSSTLGDQENSLTPNSTFSTVAENDLAGMSFIIQRGAIAALRYDDFRNMILKYGGEVESSVSPRTSHVVVGKHITTEKLKSFQRSKLSILSEEGLLELIADLHPGASPRRDGAKPGASNFITIDAPPLRTVNRESQRVAPIAPEPGFGLESGVRLPIATNSTDLFPQPSEKSKASIIPPDTEVVLTYDEEMLLRQSGGGETRAAVARRNSDRTTKEVDIQEHRQQEMLLTTPLREETTRLVGEMGESAELEEGEKRPAESTQGMDQLQRQREVQQQEEVVREAKQAKQVSEDAVKKALFRKSKPAGARKAAKEQQLTEEVLITMPAKLALNTEKKMGLKKIKQRQKNPEQKSKAKWGAVEAEEASKDQQKEEVVRGAMKAKQVSKDTMKKASLEKPKSNGAKEAAIEQQLTEEVLITTLRKGAAELVLQMEKDAGLTKIKQRQNEIAQQMQQLRMQKNPEQKSKADRDTMEAEEVSKAAERKTLNGLSKREAAEKAAKERQFKARKECDAMRFKKATEAVLQRQELQVNVQGDALVQPPAVAPPWTALPTKPPYKPLGLKEKRLKEISKAARAFSRKGPRKKKDGCKGQLTQEIDKRAPKQLNGDHESTPIVYDERHLIPTEAPEKVASKVELDAQPSTRPDEPIEECRVGGFVEEDSDPESDENALFTSPRRQPSKPKSKEMLIQPPQIEHQPVHTFPTTGGKQINEEALRAYIATLDDEVSSIPEEDSASDKQSEREDSPITEEDQYHWAYHVKRKIWTHASDEDEVEWFTCGRTIYTSLNEANAAAGQEVLNDREGLATNPHARKWSRELDREDMAHYYVELPTGFIRIKVERFLRNQVSGHLPISKVGWLKKCAWDIMCKSVNRTEASREDQDMEDLFGEDSDSEKVKEQETIEVVDGIYTIMDEANRRAGDIVLDLTIPNKNSKRLDDLLKLSEAQKRVNGILDELEQTNEPFKDTVVVVEQQKTDSGAITVTRTFHIWVQQRELKGPRNI